MPSQTPAKKKPSPRKAATKKPASRPKPDDIPLPSEEQVNQVSKMIERLGLPTVILFVGGYLIYTAALLPLVDTAKQALIDISETNKLLEQHQKENDERDGERVKEMKEVIAGLNSKLDKIIEKVSSND